MNRKTRSKGKRGAELTLNTVVIGVLVVLVLVVIVSFFLGGTSKIKDTIAGVLGGSTAGSSLSVATENCRLYCQQAKNLPEAAQHQSAYCRYNFKLDLNNDGNADEKDYDCRDPLFEQCYPTINCEETSANTNTANNNDDNNDDEEEN